MKDKPILGPLQPEDTALLQAVIRMTDPKLVVEFGFLWGNSARAMLEVMSDSAKLISYDNAKDGYLNDLRFTFIKKSQTEFEPIENVNLVFLDASHDFELNKETLHKVIPCLSPLGIIAIHDTGTWSENIYNLDRGYVLNGRYLHCPDERATVNWLKVEYPEFQQIHFHSNVQLRHGITLLQRYNHLDI